MEMTMGALAAGASVTRTLRPRNTVSPAATTFSSLPYPIVSGQLRLLRLALVSTVTRTAAHSSSKRSYRPSTSASLIRDEVHTEAGTALREGAHEIGTAAQESGGKARTSAPVVPP